MATRQSVTCQPFSPAASRARVLDRLKKAAASIRHPPPAELTPGPDRRRIDPQPDRGHERVGAAPAEAPAPTGRSMQIGVVSRNSTSTPKSLARVSPDHLLLHFAVERDVDLLADVVLAQVDQRILLGQLGQRASRAPRSQARAGGPPSPGSAARSGAPRRPARRADGVADLDVAEAPELADPPGAERRATGWAAPPSKTLMAVTFAAFSRPNASRSRTCTRRRTSAHRRSSRRPRRARP